jgi:poly(A) polymerase
VTDPRIVPRAQHPISRRDIDPDALKVLYRLRQFDHVAFLVGGSVRDLLLGRRPKDFDVGTSAHPYQVKKLFRNCWIIGRRFRLAHIRFGSKVIEVATFRRQIEPGEEIVAEGVPVLAHPAEGEEADGVRTTGLHHLIHRDNTFGTPEEDAFRRDFTINALFYDIATFSVIDYVGGLDDLKAAVVRAIGDPEVRMREDPVRMMRAVALAARLDFRIDLPVLEAIRRHRRDLARSSPPRLLEEYYKILRAGSSEKTFRDLAALGLLEPISKELHQGAADPLWRSLAALDTYRRRFDSAPDTLTNAILLGTLLVPLGVPLHGHWQDHRSDASDGRRQQGAALSERSESKGPALSERSESKGPALSERSESKGPRLGELPLARRDVERLRQILGLQRRLRDLDASPRAQRAITHRNIFRDALTWLEIHGRSPEVVEHWKGVLVGEGSADAGEAASETEAEPRRRRRRRRRRRFRPQPQ